VILFLCLATPDSVMDNPAPAPLSPQQARAFWYGLIDYERRSPAPGDLKLDRMRTLLARLGNPQDRLRLVHIAGTKGKGSTSAMLAAVFRQAGYATGLFTSPHLCRVEERFQVDGRSISEPELTALLDEVWRAGRSLAGLTFFEVATAVGFLHFVRRRCQAAVIEVGLGGRFDSTNVCRPALAVIASISFDHTRQLGNRLALIAREKAGIVKPGRPTLSGATAAEARAVIAAVCRQRGSRLRELGVDFHFEAEPGQVTAAGLRRPRLRVTTWRRTWPTLELNLLGAHQAANAAVAVACVEELRQQGWHLPDSAVAAGLAGVTWPARMEVIGRRPWVVLDCAHNVASAEAVVETLGAFPPGRRLLLFAGSSDKDLAGMFRVLAPHFSEAFLTRYGDNPRGAAPEELLTLWNEAGGGAATLLPTPVAAWTAAQAQAGPEDLVCITGSVFLAGELRPLLVAAPLD
jgi:dihydrofolate synthase/folylpolyglutamate synthase